MITLVTRSDVHLSDVSPKSRTDDYKEAMFNKLTTIFKMAASLEADAILDAGDLFHVPAASRNTHALVKRAIEVHREWDIPTYVLPGNHDLQMGSYDSLNKQPLGVMFASKTVLPLWGDNEFVLIKDGIKVRVVGVPYSPKPSLADFNIKKKDEDILICVTHAMVAKDGTFAWKGEYETEPIMSWDQLSEFEPDVFFGGHWHRDQGAALHNNKWFVYLGSIARGSLSHDNIGRTPRIGVITIDRIGGCVNANVKTHTLPVPPSDSVFNMEQHAETVNIRSRIADFVTKLTSESFIQSTSPVDAIKNRKDLSPEIIDLVVKYLTNAAK